MGRLGALAGGILAGSLLWSGSPVAAGASGVVEPLDGWLEAATGNAAQMARRMRWYDDPPVSPSGQTEPARIVKRGKRTVDMVALTFDDGYNRSACASIANTLRKHDAVGTFFINGVYLRKAPERWRAILEGMPVGNHTMTHPFLPRARYSDIRQQISRNEAIHEKILGRPMLKLLRPPYGAYGGRVRRIASKLGYDHLIMWNVDTYDWKKGTSTGRIVRRATSAGPGSIVLMHCARDATAKAMPAIVRDFERRGIELVGLDELLSYGIGMTHKPDPERYGKP